MLYQIINAGQDVFHTIREWMDINACKSIAETSNWNPATIPKIQDKMKLVVNYWKMKTRSKNRII